MDAGSSELFKRVLKSLSDWWAKINEPLDDEFAGAGVDGLYAGSPPGETLRGSAVRVAAVDTVKGGAPHRARGVAFDHNPTMRS